MKMKKFIRTETERLLAKDKFTNMADTGFSVTGYQLDENFTTVIATVNKVTYLGHAKRNPNCDTYDKRRGVTIAIARAIGAAAKARAVVGV